MQNVSSNINLTKFNPLKIKLIQRNFHPDQVW
jgi:hypothetical protein